MAETILVATLGTAPQVVTLALDALLKRGQPVSRVVVVHTQADDGPIGAALDTLRREFVSQRRYDDGILFVPHVLAGPRGQFRDVISPDDADEAFQDVYLLLRQFKHAGYRIHLSIAGGRKTMAIVAMAAAQILFDANDAVWHLVSTPEFVASQRLHASLSGEASLVQIPLVAWGRMPAGDDSRSHEFLTSVLTPAEREVTHLLLHEGLSNAALAQRLHKSPKTVANQLTSIYEKLGAFFHLEQTPDRMLLLLLLGKSS
ncbi:CRISPR-associated ring nuclease [Aggregatilinea lenta]|uniref:CRISPR-associated ring nuclease n=1 Tax=Aggregatilinea lenta TaxID=913108 RepID=UPI000E5ACB50|nr:CRISPR-associated ring nuclease [Aggregatilinea lenta]